MPHVIQIEAMMLQYSLANHVYTCVDGDQVVILDLKRDKYLYVPRAEFRALVSRMTATAGDSDTQSCEPTLLRGFIERGLLTNHRGGRRHLEAKDYPAATESLRQGPGYVTFAEVSRFFVSASFAFASLRLTPLQQVVDGVAHRRKVSAGSDAVDRNCCRERMRAFHRMRPLFPRDNSCLFDSLALLRFLTFYGQFPRWVFGVQMGPFAAHCWVQSKDLVLNDELEHVRSYNPIMIV